MNIPKLIISVLFILVLATKSNSLGFKCSQRSTCRSLIGYKTPNTTTIFHLKNFFHLRDSNSIIAANNLPSSTPSNHTIRANEIVKILIPCKCVNGSGYSDGIPIYTVQPDDGLYYIANNVFMGLVKYEQIQEVNGIEDPNMILVGEKLRIPLPCSCDDVEGERVIHYAHIVEEGTTVELIAEKFGTTSDILFEQNGIANNSQLIAETAFNVPLKVCNSLVSTTSTDYPLLVSNGTYVFTANTCVKCNCHSANNWTLQCEPSGLSPALNSSWSTCPSMLCDQSSLSLSETFTTACNTQSCAYTGFSNQTIMTTLNTVNTCPGGSPGNYASTVGLSWELVFICLHLVMLCVFSF